MLQCRRRPDGGPLVDADAVTRRAAEQLRGEVDVDALLEAWDAGLGAEPWAGPAVWAHGDLGAGNLLVRDGALAGVIDWGGLVAGDPAVDLMVALEPLRRCQSRRVPERARFCGRRHVDAGPGVGRVSRHPGPAGDYRDTNADIVATSRGLPTAIIADLRRWSRAT